MNKRSQLDDLKSRAGNFGIQMACIVIDTTFLSLWVVLQYLVNLLVRRLELFGVNRWVFLAFQVVFATATLIPIIVFIYVDIRVMIIRARKQIRRESGVDKIDARNDE